MINLLFSSIAIDESATSKCLGDGRVDCIVLSGILRRCDGKDMLDVANTRIGSGQIRFVVAFVRTRFRKMPCDHVLRSIVSV